MTCCNSATEFPKKSECVYTFCYCEENIWKLCEKIRGSENLIKRSFVIFVSNDNKTIPLWCQRAGIENGGLVLWDYHVFLIYCNDKSLVYDFDTMLDFPTPFLEYVNNVIRDESAIKPDYKRLFRVITALDFLANFSSDRRHMKRQDGTWLKEPPVYPPIQIPGVEHNLHEFISMAENSGVGQVMNYEKFSHCFS